MKSPTLYPIVLAHGVCRFDVFWCDALHTDNSKDPALDGLHYFKGIRTMLEGHGYRAYHSRVPWGAEVNERAEELRKNVLRVLDETGAEKAHIIAHSMGGLDARHMLFNDRNHGKIHHRIASLTTISTPHKGTSFADWGLKHLPQVIPVTKKLGLDLHALRDLTTVECGKFNAAKDVINFEATCEQSIRFQTYAGRQKFWGVFNALKLSFYIIEKKEGDNDGLVSVESAKWKPAYFQGVLDETDHLNELGWWDPDQVFAGESETRLLQRIHQFYAGIAAGL